MRSSGVVALIKKPSSVIKVEIEESLQCGALLGRCELAPGALASAAVEGGLEDFGRGQVEAGCVVLFGGALANWSPPPSLRREVEPHVSRNRRRWRLSSSEVR